MIFNPIQIGLFLGCSWMEEGQKDKTCHTYLSMMKLGTVVPYLNKTKKYICNVKHPLIYTDISIFYMNSSNFSMLRNTDTDSILIVISNFLNFFETLKICFIIVIAILMMSPKMTTLSLLKIKVF